MKRPQLIRFMAIQTQRKISVQASFHYLPQRSKTSPLNPDNERPSPLASFSLLGGDQFQMKLVGFNETHQVLFEKFYESDAYGNFDFKIPLTSEQEPLHSLQIFETSVLPGMGLLLGTHIPIKMKYPKKIVISDFDKTLVDTKYSTPQEVYESLRHPIDHFPTITSSVQLLRNYLQQDFQPFILSASPHFYENAIRNWLYQNNIYTAYIFLKDYRRIISLLDRLLTTKDVKAQGFYKLNSLVSILLMTGIPDQLVLMGDGFESDSLIYLVLSSLLEEQRGPWNIWNEVKKLKAFRMNRRQDSLFLNKVYELQNEIRRKNVKPKITIHIRLPGGPIKKKKITLPFLRERESSIHYYTGEGPH